MVIAVRRAHDERDYAAWRQVRLAVVFAALAGGEVIGCAGLRPDTDDPGRAEHALTVVRRDWRRRGVAAALKRTCLAWAGAHGLREVYTWSQRGNDDMRALNTHLGFFTRTESLRMQASLPLTGLPAEARPRS